MTDSHLTDSQVQPILENLWWAIPNRLAGVRQPTAAELDELRLAGIGAIVSVFHEPANLDLYQQAGLPHLWLPIAIDSVPSLEQMQAFHKFLEQQTRLGQAVAVHCSTGKHRTGTIIAAYLIGHGLTADSGLQVITHANPTIQLPVTQAAFLQQFAQGHRGGFKAVQTAPTAPISENLWWVIPGRLAGVRKPSADEIVDLLVLGIGAIVSVMDDPANLDLYQQAKLPSLWLPTPGGTAPTREQIARFTEFVAQQQQLGHVVAVHCTSGNRRTGTMLAAYLIQSGATYEQALQLIQTANPNAELRAAQLSFLQQLAAPD